MIDEEDPAVGVHPLLPAVREGAQLVIGPLRLVRVVRQRSRLAGPRVDPRGGLVTVVCAGGAGELGPVSSSKCVFHDVFQIRNARDLDKMEIIRLLNLLQLPKEGSKKFYFVKGTK